MPIAQTLLTEFEQEAALTRPFLERLPVERFTWKPHPKSMTAGQLALHIATAPGGIVQMAAQDQVPAPNFATPNPQPATKQELLDALDQSVAKVRELLPKMDDAAMAGTWSAMVGDTAVLSIPRAAVLRSILLNHWIQHRGQLGVYLRMLDVPVPSTYGPSADELPAFMKAAS